MCALRDTYLAAVFVYAAPLQGLFDDCRLVLSGHSILAT